MLGPQKRLEAPELCTQLFPSLASLPQMLGMGTAKHQSLGRKGRDTRHVFLKTKMN